MRIRSTKPEFYASERIARVSWEVRLVLKALESYVDDNGVGKDDMELIASQTFPRDLVREGSRTIARLSEAISDLHRAGLVWRYESDQGPLLFISFWDSIQRVDKPQKGRFPRPDGTYDYKESTIRDSLASPRETSRGLLPGTGEQGNRGTGEQISSSGIADANPDAAEEPAAEAQRLDVERICKRLLDRLVANGVKRAKVNRAWRDAARLMLDKDGYTEAQINFLIDNATSDEFWRTNILSMPKLREKADQLRLKFAPHSVQEPGGIRYNEDGTVDESTLPPPEDTGWKPPRQAR